MILHPKRNKGKSTPIYAGGRVVGHVNGEIFSKIISGSKHFLRQPPAILFDVSSLKDAELLGATLASVTDRETGNVYTALISLIWQKPIYKDYTTPQVGLALREWTKNGIPPTAPPTRPTPHAPDAEQPRLL